MPLKRALTGAVKDRTANDIIAVVKNGHTTFGQNRKALKNYDDREIRSGIRHARKWQSFIEATNKGRGRGNYIPRKARLEISGKQYRVVIV